MFLAKPLASVNKHTAQPIKSAPTITSTNLTFLSKNAVTASKTGSKNAIIESTLALSVLVKVCKDKLPPPMLLFSV